MPHKVIFVLIDGLAWQVAHQCMGHLLALCDAERATLYQVESALPSLSRPLYECLLTGKLPVDSGIVNNQVNRLSSETSLFHLARSAGLRTAAAAYHWVSELYNRSPYDAGRDRFCNDPSLPIQHGIFYHLDHYPDDHLFLDGEHLRRTYDPDILLIHSMNVDDAGHRSGLDSTAYRTSARIVDGVLSDYLPAWLDAGYQVLITSDHGMTTDGHHGGDTPEERLVPLFTLGDGFSQNASIMVSQQQICGILADLLGLPHDKPRNRDLLR